MLRISFKLGDADLRHFAAVAEQTQALARTQSADAIIAAARNVLDQGMQAQLAEFVKQRYARLRAMLDMVADAEWKLTDEDRQRVINALACFSAPASAAAAPTALLDHAIMIELVGRDLQHDLDAYRDFCKLRDSHAKKRQAAPGADREQWISQRRETLQSRMHERRKRDLAAAAGPVRRLFSLFRL
jgi:hypothetical protein